MAIDTREKRFSMMAMASGLDGCGIHTLPEADGSIDADDRQHLFDIYSGIGFASPVAPIVGDRYKGFIVNVGKLMRVGMILLAVLFS